MADEPIKCSTLECTAVMHAMNWYGDHLTGPLCYECWTKLTDHRQRLINHKDPYFDVCMEKR